GDVLPLAHVGQLRRGEVRVQQQSSGADLGGGQDRLEESAVVAGQHADRLARLEASSEQGVGQRIAVVLQLAERDRAALVVQRDVVGLGGGGQGDRCRDRAVRVE